MKINPNVIFILTDDQGYGDLRCLGNRILETPNIDQLYAESTRFTNFHVGPTCAPTRAGLLTGHYANSTGVWHTIGGRSLLRQDEISMADIFKANGYRTGIFGKWHLGDNYPFRPQDRGFDDVIIHGGGGIGQTNDYWGNDYFDDTYSVNGEFRKFDGYCTDVWFREAITFIQDNKDRPFFCYLPTNAPHSPYNVSERFSDLYKGKVPEERAKFFGMITCIDENIGRLRKELKELKLDKNTILIFMTDNGTSGGIDIDGNQFPVNGYNSGFRGMKNSEYEGGHRVPFFIHWPDGGLSSGSDIEELTANIDLLPTLMDLCGIEVKHHHNFDGTSLNPLINGKGDNWPDRTVVTDSQRLVTPIKWRKSATMTNRWRLINGLELYDIVEDPGQENDMAAQHPDIVNKLRRDYEKWWRIVSRQKDEEICTPIGSETVDEVLLTTHDWRNEACDCAWHQGMIREGHICNGYWEIEVVKSGRYRFELRRWPKEEDREITAGIEGDIIDWYTGGVAIPIKSAFIKVGEIEDMQAITDKNKAIIFELRLPKGQTHLQTWLLGIDDSNLGAYYVYICQLQDIDVDRQQWTMC
jgi:arylsulfatase A-like enzyme